MLLWNQLPALHLFEFSQLFVRLVTTFYIYVSVFSEFILTDKSRSHKDSPCCILSFLDLLNYILWSQNISHDPYNSCVYPLVDIWPSLGVCCYSLPPSFSQIYSVFSFGFSFGFHALGARVLLKPRALNYT